MQTSMQLVLVINIFKKFPNLRKFYVRFKTVILL